MKVDKYIRALFVLCLCTSLCPAYAFDRPRWYAPDLLDETARQLEKIDRADRRSLSEEQGVFCEQSYQRLYAANHLDVAVFFGFSELVNSGLVIDPYSARDFAVQLQKNCTEHVYACGFRVDADTNWSEGFQLHKQIHYQDKKIAVSVRLYDSAVADNYEVIVSQLADQQRGKSERVQQQFLQRLEQDDVVFYVGHARQGTGPGFLPFETFSEHWWRALLPGSPLDKMSVTLQSIQDPPKLIGLFACSTQQHYEQRMRQVSPGTALILSDGKTYSDMDSANLLGALNALLGHQCKDEFERAISISNDEGSYHLQGFFREAEISDVIGQL